MTMPSNEDDSDRDPGRLTVLTFTLGDDRYCVRLDAVTSVFGVADTGPLDDSDDPWNAGSISVDGRRLRVVDLARIFAPASRAPSRADDPAVLVLTDADDEPRYGWLVDRVGVTQTVRRSALEPSRASARFVEGRFDLEDGEAIWLDEREMHG